ncbi:uncharacterized protein LOC130931550 isoform X2 [Corythoichthys intestinalis]|uniref:uncharacterized protein LOC130931550 isoform X2 n=1 Tax=Corythoichthys intestinalis TaxID=161448 RepID=UPI0025A52F5F|nr:uncharacterized protein LOC130931550 isoform X2 [Corythoichthys intestinalis]
MRSCPKWKSSIILGSCSQVKKEEKRMTGLDSKSGFNTLVSQYEDDLEPAGKNGQQASCALLYKAAVASLVILAALLVTVDIYLLNYYLTHHETQQSVNDAELIERQLIRLQESYEFAVRNMTETKKQLHSEMIKQTRSNWEFEHHKRRTKDYEEQLDKIAQDRTAADDVRQDGF